MNDAQDDARATDEATPSAFAASLAALDAAHLRRTRRVVAAIDGPVLHVDGAPLLSFCSNDYLGLSQHPALIDAAQRAAAHFGVGAGASPMVSGHSSAHQALEEELAEFVGLPRALYFHTGYGANTGIVPALAGRSDAIFSDALNHACLIDGARLSRAAIHVYPHGDLAALERALDASTARRKLVLSDAVFSMDGDIAPVPELLRLCERHDALLLLDDAHGFGLLGPEGRGAAAHFGVRSPRLVYMATLGKAAGVSGAFVAGAADLIEWLLQTTRTYIFSTAAPAMIAAALRASLRVIAAEGWRRERLAALIAQLRAGLIGVPWRLLDSTTAIQPLVIGANLAALDVMNALRAQGLWVPAIRPPTVPAGTARLRITLSAAHDAEDVARLIGAVRQAAQAA
ncbi:MAG TPA: 8-amino-7-oxononanoate synthase [Burkholderiaceae bacterium]|nr:8-amino-7-oxononanoate synthase [Burkholderiaceae bacterium]